MAVALFVCLHNAGRSQMSAALLERAAAGRHRALSAGSEADPGGRVHPQVVAVMRELGIDLADRRPQRLTTDLATEADVVVTMGCGDACPYIPGKRYLDWDLPDHPVAARIDARQPHVGGERARARGGEAAGAALGQAAAPPRTALATATAPSAGAAARAPPASCERSALQSRGRAPIASLAGRRSGSRASSIPCENSHSAASSDTRRSRIDCSRAASGSP
jgi:arsenate reductase (thioredoxin)